MNYFTEGGVATYGCGGYTILGAAAKDFFFSRHMGGGLVIG
jgi:hypothetical protein